MAGRSLYTIPELKLVYERSKWSNRLFIHMNYLKYIATDLLNDDIPYTANYLCYMGSIDIVEGRF